MTYLKQFRIKEGTPIIRGKAAPQNVKGVKYSGGVEQMFINDKEDLLDVN